MKMDELAVVVRAAAEQVVARNDRPLPATVVLPMPNATRVTTLEGFPDDDPTRFDLLARFASEHMRPEAAPCFGFVAEAEVDTGDGPVDVVVAAYGARLHHPQVTAAPIDTAGGLGEWTEPEELADEAMPFLAPLQHAVDDVGPDEVPGGDVLGLD